MSAGRAASALALAVVLAAASACGSVDPSDDVGPLTSLPTPSPTGTSPTGTNAVTGTVTTGPVPSPTAGPTGSVVPRTSVPTPQPPRSTTRAPQPPSGCGTAPAGTVGGKLPQTITFPKPANATWPGASTFSACSSSGLPVTYTVTEGGCTLVGANRGTASNAFADCAVTASQAGDTRYAPARPVTSSYRIDPIVASVSLGDPVKEGGGGGPGRWTVTVTARFTANQAVLASVDVGPAGGGCAASSSTDISRAGPQKVTVTVTSTPCSLRATLSSAQVSPADSAAVTIPDR